MATPSLAMIPSAIADSKVYSVLPNNGDGDFTFNRDSSATRVGQNGLIQTVGYFGNDIVLNGDFSNGSTNWALNSNWSVANNKATADGTSNSIMFQSNVLQDNTLYLVSYTLSNFTQGSININLSGVSGVTRTTNGTYTEYVTSGASPSGRLDIQGSGSFIVSITNISVKEVTGDQPRLNYDISNGVVQSCPSLLLEPASTNLITYSEDFIQWTDAGTTTVLSNITNPSGGLQSYLLSASSSATNALRYDDSFSVSANYSYSLFLKAGTSQEVRMQIYDGSSFFRFAVNPLNNFAVVDQSGVNSYLIEDFTNGWKRVSINITTSASASTGYLQIYPDRTGNLNNVYIFGAQLEALSYATSYIPNFGQSAGVTRAAETCFGAGTSSTFNSPEGVLYAEISALANDLSTRKISLSDGTSSNAIYIGYITTTNKIRGYINVANGGGQVVDFTLSDITAFSKFAVRWLSNGNATFWANGSNVGSMTAGAGFSSSTLSQLQFTREQGGTAESFFGNTKDIRVYNEALTDAQLQTLTTL